MGATAGIFLASILLKEMHALSSTYIRYLWFTPYPTQKVQGCRISINFIKIVHATQVCISCFVFNSIKIDNINLFWCYKNKSGMFSFAQW